MSLCPISFSQLLKANASVSFGFLWIFCFGLPLVGQNVHCFVSKLKWQMLSQAFWKVLGPSVTADPRADCQLPSFYLNSKVQIYFKITTCPGRKRKTKSPSSRGSSAQECSKAIPRWWHEVKVLSRAQSREACLWPSASLYLECRCNSGSAAAILSRWGDDSVRMVKGPRSHKTQPGAIAASNCYILSLPMWRNRPTVCRLLLNPILPDLHVTDNWWDRLHRGNNCLW